MHLVARKIGEKEFTYYRVQNKHVPGCGSPDRDEGVGLEDGPCLAPELVLG